ncbi:MAG: glycosyltransferase family 4 protein [Ideonella sp.]|jgi:hypothetical protein|nr:glycosyltransferase family 4 protein [Ideonella sp.]
MTLTSRIRLKLSTQRREMLALYRQGGWPAVWHRVRQRTSGRRIERPLKRFGFALDRPVGPDVDHAQIDRRTMNWILVPFDVGSGGHMTALRKVHALEKAGFRITVVVDEGRYFRSADQFRALIREHYQPIEARVVTSIDDAPPAWITVATGWPTAYTARNFRATVHRCYLVQDYEPWFYAVGSESALAEATYRMGMIGVTAGDWLAQRLRAEFGMETHPFGFSYDRAIYYPPSSRPEQADTVFFYARPTTERRAFELGLLVLGELHRRRPTTRIVLAGGELSGFDIPFPHRSEGVVSPARLGELYREADAALVFSLTNASLIPLESMACGTVVVSNDGPTVEWLLDEHVAVLVEAAPEPMVQALQRVLDDRAWRERLRDAGLRFAQATDWQREAERVVKAFESVAARAPRRTAAEPCTEIA